MKARSYIAMLFLALGVILAVVASFVTEAQSRLLCLAVASIGIGLTIEAAP
jgi:hypothetical protein